MARAPEKLKHLAYGIEPSNRKFRLRLARYRYLGEALGQLLPPGESLVLDAGCGKGRLGLYWSRMAPAGKSARIVGVDLSRDRLGMAEARGYAQLLRGNLLRPWPFKDALFDAVICEQVLEHFEDRAVRFMLAEIARVLKPGGLALIGTPVFSRCALWLAPLWKPLNRVLRRTLGKTPPQHLQHFPVSELVARIAEQGLVPERVRGFRLISLPLHLFENQEWFYRMQRWLGTRFPGLCTEVNISARKGSPVKPENASCR